MEENYQNKFYDVNKEVMTLGQWMITLLIMAVPCVGFVMYFVWAFGNGNENRKNFCRAALIYAAISIVLCFIFSGVILATVAQAMGSY